MQLQNQNNYGNRIDPFIPKTSSLQDTTSTYVGDALPSSYASPEYFLPNIRNGEVDVTNYQSEDFSKTYFPISSNLARVSEFDNRIYASDPKINGEFVDSWGQFKAANYLDVDGHHGPLNKLETPEVKLSASTSARYKSIKLSFVHRSFLLVNLASVVLVEVNTNPFL